MIDFQLLHAPSLYDFRKRATLWGPISDLVPSTPVFDMYPIGFSTMMAYLQRAGYQVRIANLAARMVRSQRFEPEPMIARMKSRVFGIDLHWLPHAHGALAIAEIVKRHHPDTPVVFGGYSSTYFHEELIRRPTVDYILRGDSTEVPLRMLMEHIVAGTEPVDVPNLTWKNREGEVFFNSQSYIPDSLDHLDLNYHHMVRSVVRDVDLFDYVPFSHWLEYPIMASLTVKGCTRNCTICGGSANAARLMTGRCKPAYRTPELLAQDVREMGSLSRGPVFILGDLRQAGMTYAERFFKAIKGHNGPVILEFFGPVDHAYMERLARAIPHFYIEFSPESHDPEVRSASGKHYTNQGIEQTIQACLDTGVKRFDLFFMIGLSKQTPQNALETIDYCGHLLEKYDDSRLIPFTSPLAPFLDPGSNAYEHPEKYGYRRFAHTLEDHRHLLTQPTWKHILSYETEWMSRDQLASVTYESGYRLNRLKREHGIISQAKMQETEDRIDQARELMGEIEDLMVSQRDDEFDQTMMDLKPRIDRANTSTVCDKEELDVDVGLVPFKLLNMAKVSLSNK